MTTASTQNDYVRWDGNNLAEVRQFLGDRCLAAESVLQLVVDTPDGPDVVTVRPNGWVRRDGSTGCVDTPDAHPVDEPADHVGGNVPLESIVDSLAYEGGFD